MGDTIQVKSRSFGVTEFTESSAFVDKTFVVTSYFFTKSLHRIHPTITVLDVTLQEYTFDKHRLFTVAFFNDKFDLFDFFCDQFHLISL